MSKEYVYLGQYYHKHGKDLQELGITEKKIGKTKNPDNRERGLNSTKMTIGYKYIAVWVVQNMSIVETILHTAFDDNRLSGEWFEDPNDDLLERIDKILSLSGMGEKVYEDEVNTEEETTGMQAKTKFSVEYNGKLYNSNGSQIMVDVFSDIIDNHHISDKWINAHPRALRYEAWENPNKSGHFYTKELNSGLHVVTCISNKRKKFNLEAIAKELNLDLTVNYEYIQR